MYLGFHLLVMLLVYTTPSTVLWLADGSPNTAMIVPMMLHVGFTWVLYLLVQGSDPGKRLCPTVGFVRRVFYCMIDLQVSLTKKVSSNRKIWRLG
jgi:hypothetical protein